MASEAQARKTRRSSRGPPAADQQPLYDAPPRDASRYAHYQQHQQPQRPQRNPADRDRFDGSSSAPQSRMPAPSQRSRPDAHAHAMSPKVDAARLGLRKEPQSQPQPHSQPRTPTMPNRALQSIVTLDAQEQVSLSDGDVPPAQGQKPRKGQRSPAKSAADDKKSRRASHLETRSPSSSSAGGGLSRQPTTRMPSGGGQNLTSNRDQQRRPSPSPDPGYPWSSSRSRPVSPAQAEEQDSDSEPFSLDVPLSKGRGPTAPLIPNLGTARPTTPSSSQSNYSGDRQQRGDASPRRTDSPRGHPESRPRERERERERDRERADPARNKGSRVERALADVASETAKQTASKYEEYRRSIRGYPSPSENAEPAHVSAPRAPPVPSRPSTSDGVMSPTPPPRPSSSKVDATKAIGLGIPSQQPQQEQKQKSSSSSSRSFRFKSDSKPSPRQEQEAFFKNSPAAGSPMQTPNIPQTNAGPPPPPSKTSRIPSAASTASPPAPPPPSPAVGGSTSNNKRPGSAGGEGSTPTNKITSSASRSLKGLRISSFAARFAPGRNRNASSSPSSPASPEVSPTIESFVVSSRIPRGRGPSGLTSPPVQPAEQQHIGPSESTGSAVEMHGAPASPLVMTNPDESPTDSIAPRRPEPPSRKPSQDQRMHALMDGLGFMLGGLGSPKGEERAKRGEQQQDKRGASKKGAKRQDSSPALRRTPEGTPILELQGTPERAPRPASRASIGAGTPRAASRSYYRPESEVASRPEPEVLPPRHEPAPPARPVTQDFDEPELETNTSGFDDEDDDTGIWTPDDQFENDYLPDHEIREEDLPPQSEDRHQQLDDHQDEFDRDSHTFAKGEHGAPALPSDSELSSLGSMNQKAWNAVSGESELSTGAEALFKTLQSPEDSSLTLTLGHDAQESSRRTASDNAERTPTPDDHAAEFAAEQHERYAESEADDEESAADYAHRKRTWRSTIAHAAYDALLERHGAQEMQRQELIWEMCESEAAFVREMRSVVRTFVQPLRTQERKWIPGVPPDVMRLFDWLDDIVQLHAQMFSALHSARSKQYPIVTYIAETLRPFVPRLELHQPYLVRLESVGRAVEELIADSSSDFGEFARMQLQLPEWSSKTLTAALRLPTTHCMDYPAQFQKLWQCTPRSHPDHLATFSLYHSTELIVRVMLEVRSREEEYERVKDLSTRISGLPHNFTLARRERRLVAQGLLRRVQLSDQERAILDGEDPGPEEPHEVPLCMPILSPQYHTMRNFSPSLSSTDWLKSPRSLATARPDVRNSMVSSPSFASSIVSEQDDDSRAPTPRGGSSFSSRLPRSKQKDALVYVFVFTDLVLLTTRTEARDDFESESFRLVDDIGMARVLGVTDHSGRLDYDQLLSLDVLPMPQEHGGVNVLSNDCIACPVYLSLSERAARAPSRLMEEAKQQWMQAFHKCFMFTLRSLSFPCHTGDDLSHGPTVDYEMDTKMSVMSILSSGLPLPKSPSQLIGEHERGRPSDAVIEEREERGWWAVRFRQVLREMQRQDITPLAPSEEPPRAESAPPAPARRMRTSSAPDSRRRSVMMSRPLLLSATPSSSIMVTPASPRKEGRSSSASPSLFPGKAVPYTGRRF